MMTGRPESGPDRDDNNGKESGPDDRDNEDNNPNINDGRPSTHPYHCEQLLAGWTAGAMDDDDTGIGGEMFTGDF